MEETESQEMRNIMRARLRISNKLYPLYEGHNTIGRTPSSVVNIKNLSISHYHAVITIINEKSHYISDFKSSNGTLVDDVKLIPLKLYKLCNGASVKFADVSCIFELVDEDNENVTNLEESQNVNESFYALNTQEMNIHEMSTQIHHFKDVTARNSLAFHEMPTQIHFDDIPSTSNNIKDLSSQISNANESSNDSLDYFTMLKPSETQSLQTGSHSQKTSSHTMETGAEKISDKETSAAQICPVETLKKNATESDLDSKELTIETRRRSKYELSDSDSETDIGEEDKCVMKEIPSVSSLRLDESETNEVIISGTDKVQTTQHIEVSAIEMTDEFEVDDGIYLQSTQQICSSKNVERNIDPVETSETDDQDNFTLTKSSETCPKSEHTSAPSQMQPVNISARGIIEPDTEEEPASQIYPVKIGQKKLIESDSDTEDLIIENQRIGGEKEMVENDDMCMQTTQQSSATPKHIDKIIGEDLYLQPAQEYVKSIDGVESDLNAQPLHKEDEVLQAQINDKDDDDDDSYLIQPTQALEELHKEFKFPFTKPELKVSKPGCIEVQMEALFASQSDNFVATQQLVDVLEETSPKKTISLNINEDVIDDSMIDDIFSTPVKTYSARRSKTFSSTSKNYKGEEEKCDSGILEGLEQSPITSKDESMKNEIVGEKEQIVKRITRNKQKESTNLIKEDFEMLQSKRLKVQNISNSFEEMVTIRSSRKIQTSTPKPTSAAPVNNKKEYEKENSSRVEKSALVGGDKMEVDEKIITGVSESSVKKSLRKRKVETTNSESSKLVSTKKRTKKSTDKEDEITETLQITRSKAKVKQKEPPNAHDMKEDIGKKLKRKNLKLTNDSAEEIVATRQLRKTQISTPETVSTTTFKNKSENSARVVETPVVTEDMRVEVDRNQPIIEEVADSTVKRNSRKRKGVVTHSEFSETKSVDSVPTRICTRQSAIKQDVDDEASPTTRSQAKVKELVSRKSSRKNMVEQEENSPISPTSSILETTTVRTRRLSANSRALKNNEEKQKISKTKKKEVQPRASRRISEILDTSERSKRQLKPKVVFTMMDNPELESVIRQLGGSVVDTVDACTVLVTESVKRSQKLLCAVGQGKPICSPEWLYASKKTFSFLDPWDFLLVDAEAEKKWKFSLKQSLERSTNKKLLDNYTFQIIVNTAADVLKGAITACGGKCVTRNLAKAATEHKIIVSTPENKNKWGRIVNAKNQIQVVEAEAIFDGTLRQEVRFEKYLLT